MSTLDLCIDNSLSVNDFTTMTTANTLMKSPYWFQVTMANLTGKQQHQQQQQSMSGAAMHAIMHTHRPNGLLNNGPCRAHCWLLKYSCVDDPRISRPPKFSIRIQPKIVGLYSKSGRRQDWKLECIERSLSWFGHGQW